MNENAIDMILSCKHSSTMLLNLINDLLDLAKTEKKTF
jgi:signal transduction histidine kinase